MFILMINDLNPPDVCTWKYVDDTTLAECVPKAATSHVQDAVTDVVRWSSTNKLQLNAEKCKEVIIDFKIVKSEFDPIVINDRELCVVDHAKILGVTISNSLQWNDHICNIIKKANKRLYFLVLLRSANLPSSDIVRFVLYLYSACVRILFSCFS